MKKLFIILVVAVLAVCGISLFACDFLDKSGESFVSIDINPRVDFFVNAGVVESVCAGNEDGKVLLANEDYAGMKIEDAAQSVVELSIAMGYIDVNTSGKEVKLSVIDANGNTDVELFGKIEKKVNRYFQNNGIFGCIAQENLDEYLDLAIELNRPLGHIKMMMLAIERTDKTLDEVKDLMPNQLRALINNNQGGANKPNCDQECINKKEDKINQNKGNMQKHQNGLNGNKKGKQKQVRQWRETKANCNFA